MAMHRFRPYALVASAAAAVFVRCGGESSNPRLGNGNGTALGSGNAASGSGTTGTAGLGGFAGGIGPIKTGTTPGSSDAGAKPGGTGSGISRAGAGGNGSATSSAAPQGITSTNAGSGGIAIRSDFSDDGNAGVNETFDFGNTPTHDIGGIGGTLDTGIGGTLDTGIGGTLDTGIGGTIDTGAGGTIDTCVPSCKPDLLGVGERAVNLVVFENATAGGCDTEGRMWVGGNAKLDGYGVGAQLEECDPNDPVLVVGGNLDATGGVNGRIWVGGTYTGHKPACGTIASGPPAPVDFAVVEAQLTAYSRLLASYPVNGTTTSNFGATQFKGTSRDMNIFTITGEQLAASNGFTIDVPAASTAIINVTGTTAGFSGGSTVLPDKITCGSGAVKLNDFCNRLVWNLPDVKTITISGTAVQGTILAPRATLSGGGANVNGTVIVNNFAIDGCVEMHPHYFNGCLCTEAVDSVYACCPR